jgi:cardiolipin synthase
MTKHRGMGNNSVTLGLAAVGAGALVLHGWRLATRLFGPVQPYRIDPGLLHPIESEEFLAFVAAITDSAARASRIDVLNNGEEFYPAELEAARAAGHSLNLEAYEFQEGEITRQFLEVFQQRARAGVQVRLMIDAIGSWGTKRDYLRPLTAAGGHVTWYHPVDWKHWPDVNRRSHRKMLTVDGKVGFIGGAGFADHWRLPNAQGRPWRDTVFRLEGAGASGLNSVFAENWLEATGELIAGPQHFPRRAPRDGTSCLLVSSTPGEGATRARVLFQTLIEASRESIDITTPYFVPDRSARGSLVRALRERGVRVRILMAGAHSDHSATRRLGRVFASELVQAGAEIYEYGPAMIHAKLMTVDGLWAVGGSTNFDHRSFALNDEVNIALRDSQIAARLTEDFDRDLAVSTRLSSRSLEHRSITGRALGEVSWVLRREQ